MQQGTILNGVYFGPCPDCGQPNIPGHITYGECDSKRKEAIRLTNWERDAAAAEMAQNRINPYSDPVLAGPWWLGFNDARQGRVYHNDYVLRVDQWEYQQGYDAGSR